jgi:hypothetical protein
MTLTRSISCLQVEGLVLLCFLLFAAYIPGTLLVLGKTRVELIKEAQLLTMVGCLIVVTASRGVWDVSELARSQTLLKRRLHFWIWIILTF